MRNFFLWILFYTSVLALSQVLLKLGLNQIGGFSIKDQKEIFALASSLLRNFYVMSGMVLMASSFFLWITILSWFKLSLAFPLTSLAYVIVAALSYLMLNERLFPHNYLGIGLIACGIFLLLYKQI